MQFEGRCDDGASDEGCDLHVDKLMCLRGVEEPCFGGSVGILGRTRGVHGSDWCGLGQIRHQSVTYGLTDLESVTNP